MESLITLVNALVLTDINFDLSQERGNLLLRVKCKEVSMEDFDTGKNLINSLIKEVIKDKCSYDNYYSEIGSIAHIVYYSEDLDFRVFLCK